MSSLPEWCFKIWVIVALSIFCYLNALEGELCFDDMFAVLYNGDTSPDQPYLPLWQHDFWGNDISLNASHKSYRPITVSYFRIIRQYTLHKYLLNPQSYLINNSSMRESGIHPEYIHREKDLQPFYLHFGNILLHSINSIFVMILVLLLFNHYKHKYILSFISSLLFALHPIHVEAVTGIVGAAELLSCLFGLLSFFCYIFAHNAYFTKNSKNTKNVCKLYQSFNSNECVAFIFWSICATIFYYLSALSKEGGVTITALMMIYTVFKFWDQLMEYYKYHETNKTNENTITFSMIFYFWFNTLIHLLLFIQPVIWLFTYFKLRQYLAGSVMAVGHEVFRRTENPVAFAKEQTTRILTIPYLHYYYLSLLIYPYPLSADYSFNCIPMIYDVNDMRNILWIATYIVIFGLLLLSGIKILYSLIFGINTNNKPKYFKYWDVILILSWMIIPFIPASNLFFFVATFIAERLLYLPSIGFCIGLSYILVNVSSYFTDDIKVHDSDNDDNNKQITNANKYSNKLLLWFVVGVILSLYGYQTYYRNYDWMNEETLFESAYSVCPNSVKVLQNSAILDRRYLRFDESLSKLYRAKEIDSTFCQADHWIGVTMVNKGDIMNGLKLLKKSLNCKFALKDTAQSLQKLFSMLLKWHPSNPIYTHEWGSILYKLEQKDNVQGAYSYLTQSLNQFIVGSMKHLMVDDDDDDDDVNDNDATKGGLLPFQNRLDVADRIEDILNKLNEQTKYKYGANSIDCFHKLAQIIADWNRIYYRIERLSISIETKYLNVFQIINMISTSNLNSNKNKKKKQKLIKKQKKKMREMDLKKRKIYYKTNLLKSYKKLAEITISFIINDSDCSQEIENTDIPSWQNTWNYFALNIIEAILITKNNMKYNLNKYFNKTAVDDNEFWNGLQTQYDSLNKIWNKYKQNIDYDKLSDQQRNILMKTDLNSVKKKHKKRKKTIKNKNKNVNLSDFNSNECSTEMSNRYTFLEDKLKDKSREDHFWGLVSLKKQIDKTIKILKDIISNNICDKQVKIWALDGLAIILTPYIKKDKNEWNFDGLLENKILIKRIKQTGFGNNVNPTIQMIAELYPYLQQKMKQLNVNDMINSQNNT